MLRFIIILIVVIIDFAFAIPYFLIELLVGMVSVKAKDKMSQFIIRLYLSVISFLSGAKVTYKGLENIPKDRAVLYVGNHLSFFDVILTYPKLYGNVGYIAKKEFEKIPILAQAMKMIYCLFLDRNDIKQGLKIILKAIEYINSGISIFIFPEGTRSRDGKIGEFKEGSMKIATKSNCPVIPVALCNTCGVFENQFPKIRPAKVIIEFGEPIDISTLGKEEQKHLGKKVHDVVEEMLQKNLEEI